MERPGVAGLRMQEVDSINRMSHTGVTSTVEELSMSDSLNCPFCAAQTKPGSDGLENNYRFRCPNCGTFLMSHTVYRKMSKGEFATFKPMMLKFIEQTPAGKVAHFGFKVSMVEGESGLRSEYRLP